MAWKGAGRKRKPPPRRGVDWRAETSIQRRLWALRQERGFSRTTWAAVISVAYSTVDFWDAEEQMPRAHQIGQQAVLLNASLEDIFFGLEGRAAVQEGVKMPEVMRAADVRNWLAHHNAAPALRSVVLRQIKNMARPATREWLERFVGQLGSAAALVTEAQAWEASDRATDGELEDVATAAAAKHIASSGDLDELLRPRPRPRKRQPRPAGDARPARRRTQ